MLRPFAVIVVHLWLLAVLTACGPTEPADLPGAESQSSTSAMAKSSASSHSASSASSSVAALQNIWTDEQAATFFRERKHINPLVDPRNQVLITYDEYRQIIEKGALSPAAREAIAAIATEADFPELPSLRGLGGEAHVDTTVCERLFRSHKALNLKKPCHEDMSNIEFNATVSEAHKEAIFVFISAGGGYESETLFGAVYDLQRKRVHIIDFPDYNWGHRTYFADHSVFLHMVDNTLLRLHVPSGEIQRYPKLKYNKGLTWSVDLQGNNLSIMYFESTTPIFLGTLPTALNLLDVQTDDAHTTFFVIATKKTADADENVTVLAGPLREKGLEEAREYVVPGINLETDGSERPGFMSDARNFGMYGGVSPHIPGTIVELATGKVLYQCPLDRHIDCPVDRLVYGKR